MTTAAPRVKFREFLKPNVRPYMLAPDEDADLVGMRWYGYGPFHRELKPALRIAKKSHFQIRAGDVIYNKLFAWKGAFGLVDGSLDGMFVSDKFPTYSLDRGRVNERYLAWFFRYNDIWEQSRRMSTGSAALSKLTLNPPKFLELEIPLPGPEEQDRIADKIDAIASKVAQMRKRREEAEQADQSLIWSVCDEYLRRSTRLAEPEPLIRLVDPSRGISYGVVQTGLECEDGIPTVRAGDLQWFHVSTDSLKKVDPAVEKGYQRTRLRGTELLLRIRGGVGELAICPPELAGGNVSREVAVIPLLERVEPRYAMFMLAAPASQARMHRHIRGTSHLGINLKDVRTIPIPVPDRAIQMRVVDEILELQQRASKVHRLQRDAAILLDRLIPSVLNCAFFDQL
jgi:type I restriction enzyme, S subunit